MHVVRCKLYVGCWTAAVLVGIVRFLGSGYWIPVFALSELRPGRLDTGYWIKVKGLAVRSLRSFESLDLSVAPPVD